jgi:site-specific DNA-methyltransferase (adenine-specific)|tara:strand:+ start:1031 stop:2341 length:1311 start_codon:yes stop_codon:yes gene_type:complete
MIKQMKKIGNATLYCADCKDVLPLLKDIDACVTDPPYGLSFMGKAWDYDVPGVDIWTEVLGALKPGAHLLSFFGSRTYHRGAIPIEDAGFEIRDQLMWLYGSGFPKSHNIGKAVDKLQGNEREVVGTEKIDVGMQSGSMHAGRKTKIETRNVTKGASEYEGWGTALKPAHEPIVMARKPFKGTVANNVLERGTGGINIDECRVGMVEDDDISKKNPHTKGGFGHKDAHIYGKSDGADEYNYSQGRFPANVMHDGSEVVQDIFPETGKSSGGSGISSQKSATGGIYGEYKQDYKAQNLGGLGDTGTAARYFYCPKTSKKDRDEGMDAFVEKQWVQFQTGNGASGKASSISEGRNTAYKNTHPTVKPTELMRYLCRLVTPKGGVVVDPFMGSGSTGKAAVAEGFGFVGIEMSQEYFDIACARIEAEYKKRKQDLFYDD